MTVFKEEIMAVIPFFMEFGRKVDIESFADEEEIADYLSHLIPKMIHAVSEARQKRTDHDLLREAVEEGSSK